MTLRPVQHWNTDLCECGHRWELHGNVHYHGCWACKVRADCLDFRPVPPSRQSRPGEGMTLIAVQVWDMNTLPMRDDLQQTPATGNVPTGVQTTLPDDVRQPTDLHHSDLHPSRSNPASHNREEAKATVEQTVETIPV